MDGCFPLAQNWVICIALECFSITFCFDDNLLKAAIFLRKVNFIIYYINELFSEIIDEISKKGIKPDVSDALPEEKPVSVFRI